MPSPVTTCNNINLLIPYLQLEVAPPGAYDTMYPNGDDDTLFSYLSAGMGEAQMDGFMGELGLDWVTGDITPAANFGEAQMIVIYTAMKIIRNLILQTAMSGSNLYKAGATEYQNTISNSVLNNVLKGLEDRKTQLIKLNLRVTPAYMDAYWGRASKGWLEQAPLGGEMGNLWGLNQQYYYYWQG